MYVYMNIYSIFIYTCIYAYFGGYVCVAINLTKRTHHNEVYIFRRHLKGFNLENKAINIPIFNQMIILWCLRGVERNFLPSRFMIKRK